ncbi:hypothetical protein EJ03DRAFT_323885 [Teratosphaeria nubilosa]|uniref:Uncharacterized protein n=1 Tax=Teratosphaeria nubilosa TaxID=161662 RepID=A0A6G1LKJ5_9PEZI|nr:hypothetical protein EJ03DRAFT_323885 [Teratosphaeria nubilosa]
MFRAMRPRIFHLAVGPLGSLTCLHNTIGHDSTIQVAAFREAITQCRLAPITSESLMVQIRLLCHYTPVVPDIRASVMHEADADGTYFRNNLYTHQLQLRCLSAKPLN